MKITDIFRQQIRTFSFEFFPPKDEISAVDFGINVGRLMNLHPDFVSVTYGAGGSTQERTFAMVDYLHNKIGLNTVAHYTCVGASKESIQKDFRYLQSIHVKNLMLLRGDPPKGSDRFICHPGGFSYASELINLAKELNLFAIGAGCYPEKHPEAHSFDADISNLKKKVDAGVDFLITQLFFNNQHYFNFVEKARKSGIINRIIPGIIPLTAYSQIRRFTKMSGTDIPAELLDSAESYKDKPEKIYQLGVDFAITQCAELLSNGAPGIHFYTLNKSRAAVDIFETLKHKNLPI
ncbi:MAG: methylenetetrahydrofolate reductase [NAD(P)H] [Prevotellaceae bacterium]|jgi:methylenetetrahydrofolate reductase (NADPH)|nr:methylenetetrahydrofolate reductase [NAD(P)H] [Prevotellaceae bacterium]